MFSEIMKIIPKLDQKDLRSMEKTLQTRFTKLAKGFGKGIANSLKGGGLIGAGVALIDKILNPLKETQEAINRMLQSSDDIATNASQFNTTTGRLYKLIGVAKATGLDQDNLFMLITKFQTAVAQARANPNDAAVSSVKNFTGQDDTAEGFFSFITALRNMEKDQQLLVQQQIFGEKQILKMADFLQSDLSKIASETGLDKVTSEKFTKSIEGMAGLQDLTDILAVRRESQDVLKKGGLITEGMVRTKDQSERIALQKENERIANYQNLATLSQTSEKIMGLVEQGVSQIGGFIAMATPWMNNMLKAIEGFAKSPMIRGVRSLFGKGDD